MLSWERGDAVKVKLFLLSSEISVILFFCFFFAPAVSWNFPVFWTSMKALMYMDGCLSQCSPVLPDSSQEGLELVHRPLQGLQLGLRSVSL